MEKRALVVGSINLDLVADAQRIPQVGETVSGLSFRTFPGGKGANQACAAARLGTPVSMIGKLGNDSFAIQLRASLEDAGVDTQAVGVVSTSSGIAQITTDADGQNAIVVVPGANALLTPSDLDENLGLIRDSGILLTQLEIPLETVEHLAVIARREDIPLIVDPAPAQPLSKSLLKRIEWLTPNETETCSLLGLYAEQLSDDSLEQAANMLLRLGAKNVVIKRGRRGCYLALSDGRREHVAAYPVRAIDTTAAGDAFNGAFAAALLQGKDPIESAYWAAAVAAVSVTRPGAQPSMPTTAEVSRFLEESPHPAISSI